MACSFYRHSNLALVFGTSASLPAWANFSFPIDKIGKELCIPIIDFYFRV